MQSRHGSLEGAILSTLWKLEQNGIYTNTVKDVYNLLSQNPEIKRAYTTIKTVMDRLYEKKLLLRFSEGKKFYYRSVYSNREIVINSINEIANRYCEGDLTKLKEIVNSIENEELISV